jgi:hypothetical protein
LELKGLLYPRGNNTRTRFGCKFFHAGTNYLMGHGIFQEKLHNWEVDTGFEDAIENYGRKEDFAGDVQVRAANGRGRNDNKAVRRHFSFSNGSNFLIGDVE